MIKKYGRMNHMRPIPENTEILIFNSHKRKSVPALKKIKNVCTDVTFCIEGKMEYIVDGASVTLLKGDVIIMPKGCVRERLNTEEYNDYASFNVLFPDGYCEELFGVFRSVINSDILLLINLFSRSFTSDGAYKKLKCRELFACLYYTLAELTSVKESPGVKAVRKYVREHIAEKITLTDLAASAHLAPQYLSSLFKKQTGITISEYILSERTDLAKRLIITTDMKLSMIAQICGFSDYYAFSHAFSRKVGVTASEYKRNGKSTKPG